MDDYHAYMLFCSKFLKNDESTNTASEVIDPNDSAEMGIETVLKKHYQYGFKYESIRELKNTVASADFFRNGNRRFLLRMMKKIADFSEASLV